MGCSTTAAGTLRWKDAGSEQVLRRWRMPLAGLFIFSSMKSRSNMSADEGLEMLLLKWLFASSMHAWSLQ